MYVILTEIAIIWEIATSEINSALSRQCGLPVLYEKGCSRARGLWKREKITTFSCCHGDCAGPCNMTALIEVGLIYLC